MGWYRRPGAVKQAGNLTAAGGFRPALSTGRRALRRLAVAPMLPRSRVPAPRGRRGRLRAPDVTAADPANQAAAHVLAQRYGGERVQEVGVPLLIEPVESGPVDSVSPAADDVG